MVVEKHYSGDIAVRINPSGSLLYRATGEPKGSAFGDVVNEINTLRDWDLNLSAAEVFSDVQDEHIKTGVEGISKISDERIVEMVTEFGLGDQKTKDALAATLIARKNNLIQRFLSP